MNLNDEQLRFLSRSQQGQLFEFYLRHDQAIAALTELTQQRSQYMRKCRVVNEPQDASRMQEWIHSEQVSRSRARTMRACIERLEALAIALYQEKATGGVSRTEALEEREVREARRQDNIGAMRARLATLMSGTVEARFLERQIMAAEAPTADAMPRAMQIALTAE